MIAKFWRKRRTPREEQQLINFAKQHTVGGLEFDRTGLCQFVDAMHREMLIRPLTKKTIERIADSIAPSDQYLYDFAKAIQKELGVKDDSSNNE